MADRENERLSQIATRWSLLLQARGGGNSGHAAWGELLLHYHAPVYRYLRGMVGNETQAEELCQEFAVRFLRGDFRHADPDRGRFRDYLKVALQHLAGERARRPQTLPLSADHSARVLGESAVDRFQELWRAELLGRAWAALAEHSAGRGDQFYDVLRLKSEDPARTSEWLADELARRHGRPITAAGARQTLHRAREKFAELLRAVVAASIPTDDPAEVDAELAELGLLVYCPPPG
jgi:RNA polymerase sigma-70 factor (ECF subfamily)